MAATTVQRPDAIVRENGGVGCSVVLVIEAGFWRNGKNEKKEAILRKYTKVVILSLGSRDRDFSSNS
jgi:hypothetical protein